jgi:hypothetical protein
MEKYITDNFTGSIDDLLNHCTNLDIDKVEAQVKVEEKEACIQIIMKEANCDESEANDIYNEILLTETKTTSDKMVADGILYVSGHNEDGEPLFNLTELGKSVRNELNDNK